MEAERTTVHRRLQQVVTEIAEVLALQQRRPLREVWEEALSLTPGPLRDKGPTAPCLSTLRAR